MQRIISKKFAGFDLQELNLEETLFHNANGYIGVRGCLEEGLPEGSNTMRGMYINGFYETIPMKQAESLCNLVEEKQTMLNIADTQTVYLDINDERFSLFDGMVEEGTRTLDMDRGCTERHLIWVSPKGEKAEITIRRMTSFRLRSLFTMEYEVRALNFDGTVSFHSWHYPVVCNYSNPDDPRMAAQSDTYLVLKKLEKTDCGSLAVCVTKNSGLEVCSMTAHVLSGAVRPRTGVRTEKESAVYHASSEICRGEKVTLVKYTILTDSIRRKDVAEAAKHDMMQAESKGIDYYYQAQSEYMEHFWHSSEMTIDGADGINDSVSFNMYELLQSASNDCHSNIAAKGLSGEGYEGHYFWDTEMFMLPFFTLTSPETARMLLSFRYNTLKEAKRNAKLLGHRKGALYPWRTIIGTECSGYFPSGTAQYHINGVIAYAVVQYYLATGDIHFLCGKGAEMLVETARLWLDTGNYYQGKFEIHEVTGPDEYTCMVNNNYYTNCSAKYNLVWAVRACGILKQNKDFAKLQKKLGITEKELDEMQAAADAMYLPYDRDLGINPQDDSFLSKPVWDIKATPKKNFPLLLHYHPLHLYRYQVCKQADTVLAYFLYSKEQSEETMKRSYRYYEKITTHDSSLSTCVFSITASRLGMKKEGYSYFGDSIKMDLENTHRNTQDGIHTANMGGCYMAIVNGFAGLTIDENGLSINPFLPASWKAYRFKIKYHENLLQIEVTKDGTTVQLAEGDGTELRIFGKSYLLTRQESRCAACLNP